MKTLECGSCGGTVTPSFYREPTGDETSRTPRRVYYECPLCGPGVQYGPEDANQPPGFPVPVRASA